MARFQKRHYEAIAEVIRAIAGEDTSRDLFVQGKRIVMRDVADAFAAHFERDNTRFDRARFIAACGFQI